MRRIAPLAAVALIAAIATPIVVTQGGSAPGAPDKTRVTAGTYAADPGHTMVVWEVDHLGFSKYTGIFGDVTGTLVIDRSEERRVGKEGDSKCRSRRSTDP